MAPEGDLATARHGRLARWLDAVVLDLARQFRWSYLPPLMVYAADAEWGAAAVQNHRELVAALRLRDTAAVVEHTTSQFTDGARRLTERLNSSGIWD